METKTEIIRVERREWTARVFVNRYPFLRERAALSERARVMFMEQVGLAPDDIEYVKERGN